MVPLTVGLLTFLDPLRRQGAGGNGFASAGRFAARREFPSA